MHLNKMSASQYCKLKFLHLSSNFINFFTCQSVHTKQKSETNKAGLQNIIQLDKKIDLLNL